MGFWGVIPYQASIAHVGGSQNALQKVCLGKYRDADQFFNSGSFWRSSDATPANVYTSGEKLSQLNKNKGWNSSSFKGFSHDGESAETKNATKISVKVSGPNFNSSHSYDAKNNKHLRSQAGKP